MELYRAEMPCTTEVQTLWVTELMNSLCCIDYGDHDSDDVAKVQSVLGEHMDVRSILAPAWDIDDDLFILSNPLESDESLTSIELCTNIIQAYITDILEIEEVKFGYIHVVSTNHQDVKIVSITPNDIDIRVCGTTHKPKKAVSKVKGFGTFNGGSKKQETWWYSILGTQIQSKTFNKPISKDAVIGHLIKSYGCSTYKDVEVWSTRPLIYGE